MCALSNSIREKPNWWEKVKEQSIVEMWREEALQQAGDDEQPSWKLTPAMVNPVSTFGSWLCLPQFLQVEYVLEELKGYAALCDPETGVEVRFTPGAVMSPTDVLF